MVDPWHCYPRNRGGDPVMRIIVAISAREGYPPEVRLCKPGETTVFSLVNDYLVSAGQPFNVYVSVFDADFIATLQSGPREDARHLDLVQMPANWDVSFIPSNRLLADILGDVVQHALDHTGHGVNCVCMDQYAREIRLQLSKAIPPDGRTTDTDWAAPIQDRLEAKARIKHVLRMVLEGF